MWSPDELRIQLWQELVSVNLIPSSERYEYTRSKIFERGTYEYEKILSTLDSHTWNNIAAALKPRYSENDFIRVLGFGYALTRFMVTPLQLPNVHLESIVSLGALANLIVTVYDSLVDFGVRPSIALPKWTLQLAIFGKSNQGLRLLKLNPFPNSYLLKKLVTYYFSRLSQLPFANQHYLIHLFVKQLIVRMYEAENQTLEDKTKSLRTVLLQEKAALPFVVMGIPAWMSMSKIEPNYYNWHLRWLRQCGDFFGWIDDVIDVEQDIISGHPNRLIISGRKLNVESVFYFNLMRRIANRGRLIYHQWENYVGYTNTLTLIEREAFSACIVSWFGGLPNVGQVEAD